jgi:UDP-N-acetylglucosamine--N-acetylmuramyl-(pentapeptide) pyrophosphoryl-undecaprenol N-acetylglucosamine transferase
VQTKKRILIMAGGTGGHIFPALAIANELKQRGMIVHWLGSKNGMESRIVPQNNIEISYLNISGLRGKNIFTLLLAPFKISIAIIQALKILYKFKPNAVIGMGGFVTGPGGLATWLMQIPLFIHEQNSIAGLTNKLLAPLATKVMTGFANTFPNSIYTGNPLRVSILNVTAKKFSKHKSLNILILGGSLGAQILNKTIPLALKYIKHDVNIWHQTGNKQLNITKNNYSILQNIKITAFIDDMAEAYNWADLIICRAGALTISEITQIGIASILIPYPYAVDDHQTKNATFLAKHKAAILLAQTELTPEKLANIVNDLNHNDLQNMAIIAKSYAKPNATKQIVDLCLI